MEKPDIRKVRVFISSTFKVMHPERDQIEADKNEQVWVSAAVVGA